MIVIIVIIVMIVVIVITINDSHNSIDTHYGNHSNKNCNFIVMTSSSEATRGLQDPLSLPCCPCVLFTEFMWRLLKARY